MNTSGEAADQIVKMFLDGADRLVRLSGTGAKHGAVLLYSLAKQQKKTKGRARLETMLRSGKPLKVYTFKESDLPQFKKVADQYGILYSVLKEKDKTGGVFDVMVRAEDDSKIARITERFNLAKVDVTELRAEIVDEKMKEQEKGKEKKKENVQAPNNPETERPTKSPSQILADDILSAPIQGDKATPQNPLVARTETVRNESPLRQSPNPNSIPSERESNITDTTRSGDMRKEGKVEKRPSVKKQIEQIKREKEKNAKKAPERSRGKSHSKNKKSKERNGR